MSLVIGLVCGFTFLHHLGNEIWNDEFYTLLNFVLVPLKTTLLDYHVPNNHILFSLFAKAYLSCIGYTDLSTVLENPFVVRLPLALVAIAILYYYWKISFYFFDNIRWRYVSLLLLCSNAVFGNFVFQYRGYGLSMLFLSMIAYHLLKLQNKENTRSYVVLILATFGTMYTSPSNTYVLIVLCAYPVIAAYIKHGMPASLLKSTALKASCCMAAGAVLALLAYVPVFREVFGNDYVKNSTPFAFENLERMIKVFIAMSSFHYILLIFGLYYLVYNGITKRLRRNSPYWLPLAVCSLPFFFSFLHGDVPPSRIYAVILPFFTLLLSYSLFHITRNFKAITPQVMFVVIPLYVLLHFAGTEFMINRRLAQDNILGMRNQDLIYQYYNYHFNSREMLFTLSQEEYKAVPVYFIEEFDNTNMLTDAYGIKTSLVNPDTVHAGRYILITNKPFSPDKDQRYQAKPLTPAKSYFKLYLLSRPPV